MKQFRWFPRALSLLLCTALLLGACSLTLFATEPEDGEVLETLVTQEGADDFALQAEEDVLPGASEEDAAVADGIFWEEDELNSEGKPLTFFDKLFRVLNFFSYTIDPTAGYVYNNQYAPNWLFGHNGLYDALPFVAGVYADTLTTKFTYEGREWKIKLWKGSYATALAVGGEIAIYSRAEGSSGSHYFCPVEKDWMDMGMTIYHESAKLFTRPVQKQWWCTGYFPKVSNVIFTNPRTSVVMDGSITFHSEGMADLFVKDLVEGKGFVTYESLTTDGLPLMGLGTPDCYTQDGATVRLIWKAHTDNWH